MLVNVKYTAYILYDPYPQETNYLIDELRHSYKNVK